ncbi:hypothetical protein Acr_22g0007360 [Actinidia rufa]|uniref:Uncharacterized protein n=1 Tax=Actinidia rufa TaxID=165716 RepID=A0A7J0GKS3_9ERIC|nr:hypothetical protein Acr_22g0007360 [Actinidia rufa]
MSKLGTVATIDSHHYLQDAIVQRARNNNCVGSLDEGQQPTVIPKDVKGQKLGNCAMGGRRVEVTYTAIRTPRLQTFAKPFLMALHSSNRLDSRETCRETPYAPKTPRHKGGQIEGWIMEPTLPSREGRDKRQHKTHVSMDSRSDTETMATSKQRMSPEQTKSRVDLPDTLNTKLKQEGDLRAKLNGRKQSCSCELNGPHRLQRTKGENDGPLEPHGCFDMLGVFVKSRGLELKWFDKLLAGSIENFHQLTESFVAQFVINTRVPKGVEECSEELTMASYMLGLTPRERSGVRPVERRCQVGREGHGNTCSGEGPFKKRKENTVDYGIRARQGINVIFKESIYKVLTLDPRQTLLQETQTHGSGFQETQPKVEMLVP